MSHTVKIIETDSVTHDVWRFLTEKPNGYRFQSGQATNIELSKGEFRGEQRPFTFTSLANDEHLEFIIKIYEDHDGVTEELMSYRPGDEIEIGAPFGAISYQGAGVFIAGGAGITPFVSILRKLRKEGELAENSLHFANTRERDIILRDELVAMLGDKAQFVLSQEKADGCRKGRIDQEYLRQCIDDLNQFFYVCGPPAMVENVCRVLALLGADPDKVVTEDGF